MIDVYRTHKQQGFSTEHLDLSELEEIFFKDVLEKLEGGEVYIVIDALDEMDEKERKELFPVLQKLIGFGSTVEEGVCKVKIFIASRGGQRDVKLALGKDGWKRMGLEKSDTGGDIRKYVESQTDAVIQGGELLEGDVDDDLQKKIVESLVKGAEGMYVAISLLFSVSIPSFNIVTATGSSGSGIKLPIFASKKQRKTFIWHSKISHRVLKKPTLPCSNESMLNPCLGNGLLTEFYNGCCVPLAL